MAKGCLAMHLCIIKTENKKHTLFKTNQPAAGRQNTQKMKNASYKTDAAKKIALFASILVCIVTAVNI